MSKGGLLATRSPKISVLGCAVLALMPAMASAQLALTAAANAQYEYNSNVFDLEHGFPTPTGSQSYGDSLFRYGARLGADYTLSQQQFHFVLSGTEYRYDTYSLLNHSEYTIDGSWNLRFGDLIDGLVEVDRNRVMVDLFNLINAQLALQTEQREVGKLGLRVTPDWRAEVGAYTRKVDSPLIGSPDLRLTETSGQAAFKYMGNAGITAGLEGTYLRGNYSGNLSVVNGLLVNVAPAYRQWTAALTATDEISAVSTFIGQIGYTKRTSASGDLTGGLFSASGVTGDLDYRRALTGKTTAEVVLQRQISSFITGTSSEVDTIAQLNAIWQATSKISVTAGYNFTYRQYPDQGTIPNTERKDRQNFVSLLVEYDPAIWLQLRPYVNYQVRRSTGVVGGDYDATVVGLRFALLIHRGTPPAPQPFQVPEFQF